MCDKWKPSFLPRLTFKWRTFPRRVTGHWVNGQKMKRRPIRTREIGVVRLKEELYDEQTIVPKHLMNYAVLK